MITLYDYWRSSAAYRVRIALALTGEPFRRIEVDLLAGEQRGEANVARNPQGLVPTLEIDGQRLTQSLAICEYLSETRGLGLLPDDPAGRARVRALAYAVAMEIHPVANMRVARRAAEWSEGARKPEEWMRVAMEVGLTALEAMLDHPATGAFCHGDRVSLADLCLVPQVYNARRWGVDLAALPRIVAIDARLAALPEFAAAHPDRARPEGPRGQRPP
jgi:maleylacetoacetate isomerase